MTKITDLGITKDDAIPKVIPPTSDLAETFTWINNFIGDTVLFNFDKETSTFNFVVRDWTCSNMIAAASYGDEACYQEWLKLRNRLLFTSRSIKRRLGEGHYLLVFSSNHIRDVVILLHDGEIESDLIEQTYQENKK